ncbi:XPA protein C-terminus-domain-containing protein [Radiomyces spectabilis]|uniref:XPA protein C-terminus-domain-containing protein n=1 Tax=Radiomyces spectabilis TaxID=64574 RepID=UPI00222001D3|nr:XPA protein C-terminus-domain-containing protein [Radiomyces spectabilis]KAI8367611.1 XPA protein C-terminus-domain-containing protein [Radiomyces spectabilis]
MASSSQTQLTEEQRQRIQENKAKALEKLQKRKAEGDAAADKQESPKSKRSRWATPFYEYDLSTMVDTKGGFILDKAAEEEQEKKRQELTQYEPFLLRSMDPSENPKCRDCGSMDVDPIFYQIFHISVCPTCKEKFPERYSLITKTEAKEDYLLTDPELRDKELLPYWLKPNPRKSTWNNMMLYVREMVEEYAFKKWGGAEGLDAEYERRMAQKKEKKDKKFKEKLADLRRRTMTSTWERKRQEGPHKHTFGPSVEAEDGITTQTCTECGLVVESEEL